MPYFTTTQEWLTQSALLLQARPTSARITTKYTLSKPSPKSAKRRAATAATPATSPSDPASAPPAPKALLTLKTYDPVSGTTLKYQTDKAQEVGRLILSLSRLGREMAGLPELKETVGEAMEGVEQGEGGVALPGSGDATPVVGQSDKPVAKKGKKKGKK